MSFVICLILLFVESLFSFFSIDSTHRVHAALATMLRLCPKGNSDLFPILASNFPFRTKPTNVLVWYTKQCLVVLEYVPTLSAQVLELIVDKCLEMDVEIKINKNGQVSIENEVHDAQEEMFELDLDEPDSKEMEQQDVEEKVDEMADKVRVTFAFVGGFDLLAV
jgi:RNA polymerase I-specific transcription initiation factor RRN3